MACGIYSLISSFIYIAMTSFNWAGYFSAVNSKDITEPGAGGMYAAAYSIKIAVAAFLLIASIVLLDGVSQNNRTKLIPYMVAITVLMVLQTIGMVILLLIAAASAGVVVIFVVWLLFTALNITCLICVISQYQELSEGRGRASGVA
eukprot:XP_011661516.1 PREDICTED: uncharacterized protein LOC105437043 [Strongylocentrotus purpuratus]